MKSFPTLTIAGSDPSGGAGIQADLKVFHQHKVYGMSVITLLTVQNTRSVERVEMVRPGFVVDQLKAVISDIPPKAAKTGALGSPEIIEALISRAGKFDFPLIIDPVMISKHGSPLLDDDGCKLMKKELLPFGYLVTPNIPEARVLSERDIFDQKSLERAARSISLLGVKNVLIKSGHLPEETVDTLWHNGSPHLLPGEHFDTENTHGTGCVFSAAITAQISRGTKLTIAVHRAKKFIAQAIKTNPELGQGYGPVNMLVEPELD